ncbi:MAG: hypothetical protein CR965_01470 [Paludibacter sp.]|nr:MAG: hypothetical protein CR965_01470 [Paludibacter sp.]
MDLQTRKLNLITYLSQVQDENFINEVEKMLYKNNSIIENNFRPFSQKELIERIKKSERDFTEGKFKTQEELEMVSLNW